MTKIIVVTEKPENWKTIKKGCKEENYLFHMISPEEGGEGLSESKAQLIIFDIEKLSPLLEFLKQHESTSDIPTLWVVDRHKVNYSKPDVRVSDCIFAPIDLNEFFFRIHRLIWQKQNVDHNQVVQTQDLTIDLVRYEVRFKGELVDLTYKEYELLKFLAANPGKVFTREVLLNKVWGYDYFGGTRTVDVHIRRLRSKIEDHNHTYIETVRNIGYRFKEF